LRALLAFAIAAVCLAQTTPPAAVFNNFSATIKQVVYGSAQCTMWVGLAPPYTWPREVVCYVGTAAAQLDVGFAGKNWVGDYILDDGSSIGWNVKANGVAEFSAMDPNGVKLLEATWMLPPGD
jgi:hypothetical protein